MTSKNPVAPQAKLKPLPFPTEISLNNFEFLSSDAIQPHSAKNSGSQNRLINGYVYEYEQAERSLTIEMYYLFDTSGNVIGFLNENTTIPAEAVAPHLRTERYQAAIGYYLLFSHQTKDYLVSCINPKGESTVTLPQFRANRYRYDIWSPRLLRWMFTSENIRDFRCLWVVISLTDKSDSVQERYAILENVWFDWYGQWQPKFSRLQTR
ncbi:cyanoexosortase A system-associated protein [Almyronema epifaneia]|uniref:Cyanoexosortase A system-associated protein n=1 Tax=Almyronema epifaneia S1 TaxID=2991925 RepID=A0ABW6IEX2_9CYAN